MADIVQKKNITTTGNSIKALFDSESTIFNGNISENDSQENLLKKKKDVIKEAINENLVNADKASTDLSNKTKEVKEDFIICSIKNDLISQLVNGCEISDPHKKDVQLASNPINVTDSDQSKLQCPNNDIVNSCVNNELLSNSSDSLRTLVSEAPINVPSSSAEDLIIDSPDKSSSYLVECTNSNVPRESVELSIGESSVTSLASDETCMVNTSNTNISIEPEKTNLVSLEPETCMVNTSNTNISIEPEKTNLVSLEQETCMVNTSNTNISIEPEKTNLVSLEQENSIVEQKNTDDYNNLKNVNSSELLINNLEISQTVQAESYEEKKNLQTDVVNECLSEVENHCYKLESSSVAQPDEKRSIGDGCLVTADQSSQPIKLDLATVDAPGEADSVLAPDTSSELSKNEDTEIKDNNILLQKGLSDTENKQNNSFKSHSNNELENSNSKQTISEDFLNTGVVNTDENLMNSFDNKDRSFVKTSVSEQTDSAEISSSQNEENIEKNQMKRPYTPTAEEGNKKAKLSVNDSPTESGNNKICRRRSSNEDVPEYTNGFKKIRLSEDAKSNTEPVKINVIIGQESKDLDKENKSAVKKDKYEKTKTDLIKKQNDKEKLKKKSSKKLKDKSDSKFKKTDKEIVKEKEPGKEDIEKQIVKEKKQSKEGVKEKEQAKEGGKEKERKKETLKEKEQTKEGGKEKERKKETLKEKEQIKEGGKEKEQAKEGGKEKEKKKETVKEKEHKKGEKENKNGITKEKERNKTIESESVKPNKLEKLKLKKKKKSTEEIVEYELTSESSHSACPVCSCDCKIKKNETVRDEQTKSLISSVGDSSENININLLKLEELVGQAAADWITNKCEAGVLRKKCHILEEDQDRLVKLTLSLKKQLDDARCIIKRMIDEKLAHKSWTDTILPLKVTRSVGMQVCTTGSAHVLIKPPDLDKEPTSNCKPTSNTPESKTVSSLNADKSPISNGPVPSGAKEVTVLNPASKAALPPAANANKEFIRIEPRQGAQLAPILNVVTTHSDTEDDPEILVIESEGILKQSTAPSVRIDSSLSPATALPTTVQLTLPTAKQNDVGSTKRNVAAPSPVVTTKAPSSEVIDLTDNDSSLWQTPKTAVATTAANRPILPAPARIKTASNTFNLAVANTNSNVGGSKVLTYPADSTTASVHRNTSNPFRKPPNQPNQSTIKQSSVQDMLLASLSKVPPLPRGPKYPPGTSKPPKPILRICKNSSGIMLSWNFDGHIPTTIRKYQVYAYQEGAPVDSNKTEMWKKVGDVDALPLPMACTLTQFKEGHKYFFVVRAVDVQMRLGEFSHPGSIMLTPNLPNVNSRA